MSKSSSVPHIRPAGPWGLAGDTAIVKMDAGFNMSRMFPNVGGIMNSLSGMGGATDKSSGSFYTPRVFNSSAQLQVIYAQSWAARKFIDIPVDDQFILGRTFTSDDEKLIEKIDAFEAAHDLDAKIAEAQKAGRLYGTALLYFITAEANPASPLNLDRLKPGDLKNIVVIDRFSISAAQMQNDPLIEGYLEPIAYQINLPMGKAATVHHSRVVRFDGKKALTANGFQNYGDQWFGLSELTDILTTIESEDTLAKGISHLANEASIPVVKLDQLNDAVCGGGDAEDMNLDARLQVQSTMKSIFRTMFLDSNDDFTRTSVTFSGLPDLMDRFADRLAASADIPKTRFLGTSPQGMNATGESDMKNYAMSVQARQEKTLRPAYAEIDPIIARMIEVDELPPYEFPSLVDADEAGQATTLVSLVTALSQAVLSGMIDEPEARDVLTQSPMFAALGNVDAEAALREIAGISPQGEEGPAEASPEGTAPASGETAVAQAGGGETIALNGAQIKSMLEIVASVSEGTLPKDAAIAMLQTALLIPEEKAIAIIGSSEEKAEEVEGAPDGQGKNSEADQP